MEKRKKLIIKIMIIVLGVLVIFTISEAVRLNKSSKQVTSTTPINSPSIAIDTGAAFETAEVVLIPELSNLDESYKNSTGFNSKIVAKDGKIFYLVDYMLYCYDTNIEGIVFSEEVPEPFLDEKGIYLLDGYVYYMQEETINRVNVETLEIEEFLQVTDVYNDIYEEKIPKGTYNEQFNWFLLNDEIMIVSIGLFVDEQPTGTCGAAMVNEWDFKKVSLLCRTNHNPVLLQDKIVEGDFSYIKINDDFDIYQNEDYLLNEEDISVEGYIEDCLEFAGDYVFTCGWPNSSIDVYGINYKTGDLIYEHRANSAFVSMHGLDQYIFYHYYDRLQLEEFTVTEGAVIVDTKSQNVYKDSAINNIISGDITSYLDLTNMEFCVQENELYAIEREQNLVKYLYTQENYHAPEITDAFKYQDKYRDVSVAKYWDNIASRINLYKIEVIDGKLYFTLLYKEFD